MTFSVSNILASTGQAAMQCSVKPHKLHFPGTIHEFSACHGSEEVAEAFEMAVS